MSSWKQSDHWFVKFNGLFTQHVIVRVCSNRAFLTKIKVCPISAVLKLLQYIIRRNSFEFFKKHRFPTGAMTSKVKNKVFQI